MDAESMIDTKQLVADQSYLVLNLPQHKDKAKHAEDLLWTLVICSAAATAAVFVSDALGLARLVKDGDHMLIAASGLVMSLISTASILYMSSRLGRRAMWTAVGLIIFALTMVATLA